MPVTPLDPPPRRDAAVAGAALAVLCVAASSGSVLLRALDGLAVSPTSLTAVAFALPGALLVLARRRAVPGWLLLLAGSALALSNLTLDWARHALVATPGSLPAAELALWLGSWSWVLAYAVVVALLPMRLPDGDLLPGRWRWAWWFALLATALGALGWATTPYDRMDRPPLDGLPAGVTSPVGLPAGPTVLAVSLPMLLLAAALGVASLVLRLRRATGAERQQLKWVVYGAGLTVAALVLAQVVGPEGGSDLLLAVGFLPLPLGVTVAGLRFRLADVDHVIRRTVALVGLAALLVAVYAASVVALGAVTSGATAHVVAAVATVLLSHPARSLLERLADTSVPGARNDPYRSLVALGDRLDRAATEPATGEVLQQAAEAVRHLLDAPWVVVEVADGPRAVSGAAGGEGAALPLEHGGRLVGHLGVGGRLRAGDLRLLQDLTGPVAAAAHAAQLREALRLSRERLVLAREEERRRLRHDLHDELGPVLAAVALQLGELRTRVPDDDTARLAGRAEELVSGAVATVRTIVGDLRPPALDDLGLAEALRATAASFEAGDLAVEVRLVGPLEHLPAAVEVAGLRIVAEALANAVRHGHPRRVRVGVERGAEHLELTVADDGAGFATGSSSGNGVGLGSMRERAEELGGWCAVRSTPGHGTVVTVRLPLTDPAVPAVTAVLAGSGAES